MSLPKVVNTNSKTTQQLYKTSRKQWSKLNALTVVDALAFLAATNRKEAFCRTY